MLSILDAFNESIYNVYVGENCPFYYKPWLCIIYVHIHCPPGNIHLVCHAGVHEWMKQHSLQHNRCLKKLLWLRNTMNYQLIIMKQKHLYNQYHGAKCLHIDVILLLMACFLPPCDTAVSWIHFFRIKMNTQEYIHFGSNGLWCISSFQNIVGGCCMIWYASVFAKNITVMHKLLANDIMNNVIPQK